MELRTLGRTGLQVSAIGMGGIPIQRIDYNEAAEVVKFAVSRGVNFIDTARGYTDSEAKLGQVLGETRERAFVATKSMARLGTEMTVDIDESLRNLKTDYIDLYQMHNVKDKAALELVLGEDGALEALKKAQAHGKIKFIGITGHIPSILVEAIKTGEFDTVQFPFNPIETGGADELLPLAKKMNLGTIIMKPFAGGAIKSKISALRFILEHGVSTVIPGMDEISQVNENINSGNDLRPLTEAERFELSEEVAALGDTFCRRCEYCHPCPEGIDIPTVFLLDGYWTRYGLKQWAVERYNALKVKASCCQTCGICEERCPYHLPIRQKLKDAAKNMG